MLNLCSAGNSVYCFFTSFSSFFGSQVRCMPSFLKMPSSTEESRTEEWTSHPFKSGTAFRARAASGLVAALMESAIRISSV